MTQNTDWHVFKGKTKLTELPEAPPWRQFEQDNRKTGKEFILTKEAISLVNTAIYLRRPLLVKGPPGTGKSSLATAIKDNLGLDDVLVWAINSRSTVKDALYRYDPITRLQESGGGSKGTVGEIGRYLRLGPLGTAFARSKNPRLDPANKPSILLIDEIDKSDIDLPNDLLHILEDGRFEIPEITRIQHNHPNTKPVKIRSHGDFSDVDVPANGKIICKEFPIIIITSNGERELSSPFLRRCLQLDIPAPNENNLVEITKSHLDVLTDRENAEIKKLANDLVKRRHQKSEHVATDQLLNAAYLLTKGIAIDLEIDPNSPDGKKKLVEFLLRTILHTDGNA